MEKFGPDLFQTHMGKRLIDPTSLIERIRKLRALSTSHPGLVGMSDHSLLKNPQAPNRRLLGRS